jgi:hypothetical protein
MGSKITIRMHTEWLSHILFIHIFICFCKTTESRLNTSAALVIAVHGLALYNRMMNFLLHFRTVKQE